MTPDRTNDADQASPVLYHYTDRAGYNSIRAEVDWCFRAYEPPPHDRDHPKGAYFTTLGPDAKGLARRLRLPTRKLEFVFVFEDVGDLTSLRGDRGRWIYHSTADYVVIKSRQIDLGETTLVAARLRETREGDR
jgi:hypothetical protein